MNDQAITSYALYGERDRAIDPGFIHVENVSDRGDLHGGKVELHRHRHLHQLSLWRRGQGTYYVDSDSHLLKGTMLGWIPSPTVHGFAIEGDCDATVVSVSDEFLQKRLMQAVPLSGLLDWREPTIVPVPVDQAEAIAGLFGAVAAEYGRKAAHRDEALSALATLAFIAFARLGEGHRLALEPPSDAQLLYRRFRSLLDRKQGTVPTVAGMADELATTPYLLNKAVRGATGDGPASVIRQHLILEAKRLLVFTELKVAQVAFTLGFDDPAHFGRLFRRETGVAPAQWRQIRRQAMEEAVHA